MNWKTGAIITFIMLGCAVCNLLGGGQSEKAKSRSATFFSYQDKSLRKATRVLSKEFAERICFEEVQLFPVLATKSQAKELQRAKNLGVSVVVTNAALDTILIARCEFDSIYQWKRDKATDTINVYPKENAPLEWKITKVGFTNVTIRSVFEQDLLGLSAHAVNLDLQMGNHSWLDTKVSLDETNLQARVALNKLSVQLEPKMRWEIWSRHIAPGRVDHALCFYYMPH